MTILEAILLGIIQGITEFLPVSSSGHLVLAQHWLGIEGHALTFDVMVHAGSLVAIVFVLRDDIALVWRGLFGGKTEEAAEGRRLFWQVVVATLPLVAVGLLLRDWVDEVFSSPYVSIGLLFVTGAVLLFADRRADAMGGSGSGHGSGTSPAPRSERASGSRPVLGAPPRSDHASGSGLTSGTGHGSDSGPASESGRVSGSGQVTWIQAVWMGVAQAFAVLPGLSRSGMTMSAGMVTGLRREGAARFSFLMSIPAILGATILELRGFLKGDVPSVAGPDALIVGTLVSGVVTYFAVVLFLRFVRNGRLAPFAYYAWLLAAVMWWVM